MLTRILHNSEKLCTFFDHLNLALSKPQQQHILNLADALLVCEDEKTLAALQRQFIEAPDASNMADFLRISPWSAEEGRTALRVDQVAWIITEAERTQTSKVTQSASTWTTRWARKTNTRAIWSRWTGFTITPRRRWRKRRPRFQNGFCYLVCTLRIGKMVVTVDLRLYLRAKTVRRLNRHRAPEQRIPFRSKNHLARSILEALRPLLPQGWTIYVQFDSWYASEQLIKYVRRQGWQTTCGLKSNRNLNGKRLDRLDHALRHKRYTAVSVTAADGNKTTYYVREATGRLSHVPDDVRAFFSRRHPREKSPAYFMCTDLTRSAEQALQGYSGRWSCEVDNFYLKTQLGLADFRVQSYEAVDKYTVVVLATWVYVERRFELERGTQIKTYGDLIRRHRDEHAVDGLTGALEMMREVGDVQHGLQHFLRLESQPSTA